MTSFTTTYKRTSIGLSAGVVESLIVAIMLCILPRANAFVRPSPAFWSISTNVNRVRLVGGKPDTILSFNGPSSRGLVSGKEYLRADRKSRLYVASSTKSSSDQSAMSKSRAPFRMPRNSADDSKVVGRTTSGKFKSNNGADISSASSTALSWNRMGLLTELCTALQDELKLPSPTPVQSLVIPELLRPEKESMAFLAATGSGKTLAYVLPLIQQLKQQEMFESYERRPKRPRMLILAPTRELAVQITQVVKSLSHSVKLSTQALVGGQDKGTQRKAMEERPVDVVVATPGRLIQQWKDGNLFLGSVETVVLDEMDTMLEQGFQRELREILYPLLYAITPKEVDNYKIGSTSSGVPLKETAPRIIMTSATMTQLVQKLLGDDPKRSKLAITAKKLHSGSKADDVTTGSGKPSSEQRSPMLKLPPMKIISAPGLHKAVPRLEQIFVDVGNTDKVSLLLDVISSQKKNKPTIVFCNTASSVRAVQYALAEARIESLGYHGELNSATRTENLQKFRRGASRSSASSKDGVGGGRGDGAAFGGFGTEDERESDPDILVCTDIAARGLDIPEVESVVMFDFPLNAMDYLHRSGRTARGAGQGKVTALVAKRDRVLATAIQQAVLRGDTLDGLSSRKSDYGPGGPRSGTKKVRTTSSRPPRSTAPSRGQNKGTVQRGRRK